MLKEESDRYPREFTGKLSHGQTCAALHFFAREVDGHRVSTRLCPLDLAILEVDVADGAWRS
jgi:hypothetical protein